MTVGVSPQTYQSSSLLYLTDQLAADLPVSDAMRLVLSLTPLNDLRKTVSRFEGVLYKKTRLFGFKPKYVVLDRGVLSIFNSL